MQTISLIILSILHATVLRMRSCGLQWDGRAECDPCKCKYIIIYHCMEKTVHTCIYMHM